MAGAEGSPEGGPVSTSLIGGCGKKCVQKQVTDCDEVIEGLNIFLSNLSLGLLDGDDDCEAASSSSFDPVTEWAEVEVEEDLEEGEWSDNAYRFGIGRVAATLYRRTSIIHDSLQAQVSRIRSDSSDEDDDMEAEEEDLLGKTATLQVMLTQAAEKWRSSASVLDEPTATPLKDGQWEYDLPLRKSGMASNARAGGRRKSIRPLTDVLREEYRHLPDFKEISNCEALMPEMLLGVYSGLLVDEDYGELLCGFMLECCVRGDRTQQELTKPAASAGGRVGLDLRRLRGGQVLFSVGLQEESWGNWSMVDIQVVCSRVSKHRVMLVRLLTRRKGHGEHAPVALAQPVREFLDSLKADLRSGDLLNSALILRPVSAGEVAPELDIHYSAQLATICLEEALQSLRAVGGALEEHAEEEGQKYENCVALLKPMFSIYGLVPNLALPTSVKLGLSEECALMEYESSSRTLPPLNDEDAVELDCTPFTSVSDQILGSIHARLLRRQAECDEEVSIRVGRLNVQVMRRLSGMRLYLREMLQTLRNEHSAVLDSRVGQTYLGRLSYIGPEELGGVDPYVEVPLYLCTGFSGALPTCMYITYYSALLLVQGFVKRVHVAKWRDVAEIGQKRGMFKNVVLEIRMRPPMSPVSFSPALADSTSLFNLMNMMVKVNQEPADALQLPPSPIRLSANGD